MLLFLFAVAQACIPVTGKWITAKDAAAAIPEFGRIDPDAKLLTAPAGLAKRVVRESEIQAIATRQGLKFVAVQDQLCFTQAVVPLSEESVLAEIRTALESAGNHGLSVELASFFPKEAPPGSLHFGLGGLQPLRWRGSIQLEGGGSIPVTAEVRITTIAKIPVALRDLAAGEKIRSEDFHFVQQRRPWRPHEETKAAALEGYLAVKPIRAGEEIGARGVRKPLEVEKGEMVELHVKSGALELVTQARAETGGRTGSKVVLSNPTTSRKFLAEVTGRGRAQAVGQGGNP